MESTFGSSIIYVFIAIALERAYASYRGGRHLALDTIKARRPLIYTLIVTFCLTILPVIIAWLRGDYQLPEWNVDIPVCESTYINARNVFYKLHTLRNNGTNITLALYESIIQTEPNNLNVAFSVLITIVLEGLPLLLFFYVLWRNQRLHNKFHLSGTHQSLAIRTILRRNIDSTRALIPSMILHSGCISGILFAAFGLYYILNGDVTNQYITGRPLVVLVPLYTCAHALLCLVKHPAIRMKTRTTLPWLSPLMKETTADYTKDIAPSVAGDLYAAQLRGQWQQSKQNSTESTKTVNVFF